MRLRMNVEIGRSLRGRRKITMNKADQELVRAFIALEISVEVRASLERLQEQLKQAGGKVSWTRPENIHLTLVFLGELAASRLAKLEAELDATCAGIAPFTFEVTGAGCFGSARSPRVIWVGIEDESGSLEHLQGEVSRAAGEVGFPQEHRKFKPHLTLGRVRSAMRVAELTSALASAKNSAHGRVRAGQVLLMQSQLDPQGARYSLLHASPLKGTRRNGHENR